MALDQYNFVFTTNIDPWGSSNQVMRLNPRGEDVLLNLNDNVSISGDQRHRATGSLSGPSQLIDIIARPNGMFSALDRTRGRVYTYDSEGNLLYVFSVQFQVGLFFFFLYNYLICIYIHLHVIFLNKWTLFTFQKETGAVFYTMPTMFQTWFNISSFLMFC
jgi:hypothetical protein